MESIKFTNSNGQSIIFKKSQPYILQFLEGVGGGPTSIQTQKSAFQDGTNYLNTVLEPRILQFQVFIFADNESQLYERRKEFIQVLNPKLGTGELIYSYGNGETKRIECQVDLAPEFLTGRDNRSSNYQKTIFTLFCSNPFWGDEIESGEILTQSVPLFKFDLELTDTFEFERRGTNRTTIDNIGDVETPVKLIFNGPASNPKIINETTGEFIKVTKTLLDGESLKISTAFGNKYVIFTDVDGVESNAFGNIDLDSTFWKLQPGDNEVVYIADSGIDTAELIVSYRNKYVGV